MTDKVEEGKEVEGKVEEVEGKVEEKQESKVEVKYSEQEQSAISFGWMPREDWVKAGHSEDEWVPAKHFLKFGELKNQLVSKDKQVTKQDKIIKMMKDHHLKVKQTAYEEAMKSIKAERAKALSENDLAAAEALRDQMEELKEKHNKEKVLPPEVEKELEEPIQRAPEIHPEFYSWQAKNPWYIAEVAKQDDVSRTADRLGVAFVHEMRAQGKEPTVKDIYAAVETEIKKLYPSKFSTPKSRQEDSSSRGSGKAHAAESKLTEEQLQVAKNFGLTPERYLEQLKSYKGR